MKKLVRQHWKALAALAGGAVVQGLLWTTGRPVPTDFAESLTTAIEVLGPMAFVYFFPANKET